jgi:3-hydroxyisobutyrate dehydrogenase
VTTPRDAAIEAEVVFTCLPNSPEVEEVLGGGLEGGLGPESTLVDLTSGIPETSRRIAGRLSNRGIGWLDAPVSGGTCRGRSRHPDHHGGRGSPGVFKRF